MEKVGEFVISSIIICLVFTSSSYYLTQTFGKDERLKSSRYGFVYEAIDHIDNDDSLSVVGIGSSMMNQAFDGQCLSEKSTSEISYYNLGISASRSYTDMMMIPRLASSSVDVVMIEVGVNLLFKVSGEDDPNTQRPEEYLEMRLRTDTMMQSDDDVQDWVDIILPHHKEWLNLNSIERTNQLREYARQGIESRLHHSVSEFTGITSTPHRIPEIGTSEYDRYLRTPTESWINDGIDFMSKEELAEYNRSLESGSAYWPLAEGTANHEALYYEVETLTKAGKKVVIVTFPHYREVYKHLKPGQWDGFNSTLDTLGNYDVDFINYTFDKSWQYYHFRDRNHLDPDGRKEFCKRVAPRIEGLLVV